MSKLNSLIGVRNKGGFVFDEHDIRTVERMLHTNKDKQKFIEQYRQSIGAPLFIVQNIIYKKRAGAGKMSISDVRRIDSEKGHHFFDRDTMRFFNSKIETKGDLIGNKYFITSEHFENSPRHYSVREFDKRTGSIKTISEFNEFHSSYGAREFAKCLVDHDGDVEACKKLMMS
ncbi:MAG: hypothetical protein IMZ53_08475 [Thermoplasmata archaeon]|nr:hypothetical protein [Thermoplasmata archaeon]MBE3140604.1 hypothetical protein [Thermoplasmata archaeon]